MLGDGLSRPVEYITKAIHPSLCPILILLSRLKPSLISSETQDALDPFLLVPFIQMCATQSNFRVRVLASRALTGLVSNEKLVSVLSEIVHCLPNGRNQMNMAADVSVIPASVSSKFDGGETKTSRPISFNSVHGALLQLSSLLDINCRSLPDTTKKDQILGDLVQVLLKCAWIGSMKTCPCPTLNASYLHVLDQMHGIARSYVGSQHITAIRILLLELSSEYLGMEKSHGLAWHDPTKDDLRRDAVASYFSCRFGENVEDLEEGFHYFQRSQLLPSISEMPMNEISVSALQEQVMFCISDATYEVRTAILKKLFHLVQRLKPVVANDVIYIWAENHLQSTIGSFEQHCEANEAKRDPSVLHGVCVKQFSALLKNSVFINHGTNGVFVRDSGREDKSTKELEAYKCIESFIILVKQRSLPSEPVNMRKAAAESIIASGLLEEAVSVASLVSNNQILDEESHVFDIEEVSSEFEVSDLPNLYGCRILDLWFTCIRLLEDEDVVLRERLAKNVQTCIMNSRGLSRNHCGGSVPSQVARVIELSFEFLSSTFGHWLKYLDFLLLWVFDTASTVNSLGDLVRQIFDKEIDNHHEEKLLICQICCAQLEKLLDAKSLSVGPSSEICSKDNIDMFLQQWRLKLINQLTSFARNYFETERTDWIGGIGNHKDTFTSLYANLLGLYALANGSSKICHLPEEQSYSDHNLYLSEFADLRSIMGPYLRNPLIYNLYSLVIKTHEKVFGVLADQEESNECSALENFDPYFLLR
ncbi:hypothetical protein J5N97_017247 [Dioscorea zingiberensis]|uniref:tRNA (32-2'-O)-methyltransferase regulator THADA-like C-terminal TPR repeats region domain-containing protein n=1 Tax=Dioscorea zingiberensis TaxID=325984 RepID=A0A9D5CMT8_9LILI|nr:hypothetical protein J5N97_017247 [Dioscorea zingiberensis]